MKTFSAVSLAYGASDDYLLCDGDFERRGEGQNETALGLKHYLPARVLQLLNRSVSGVFRSKSTADRGVAFRN